MLKKIIALLTTLLLMTAAIAQPKAFHFTKGEQQLVLFGTIHLSKPNFFPLPASVLAALDQSDALALELDIYDPETLEATIKIVSTDGVLNNQTLVEVIGEERMEHLKEIAGSGAIMFEQMRPWLISLNLPILQAMQMGYEDQAVDNYLADKAKANAIPVIALETAQEQFEVFLNMTPAEELALLDSVLSGEAKEQLEMLLPIWKYNDEKVAEKLLSQMQASLPTLFKRIITDRNHKMVERAIKLNADKKHLFVGVGAAHLYGKGGMINLLSEQGYRLIK